MFRFELLKLNYCQGNVYRNFLNKSFNKVTMIANKNTNLC